MEDKHLAIISFIFIFVTIYGQDDCDSYTYVTRIGRQMFPGVTKYTSFTAAECMESCNVFRWCQGVQHYFRSGDCHLYSRFGVAIDDACCLVARRECAAPNRPTTTTTTPSTTTPLPHTTRQPNALRPTTPPGSYWIPGVPRPATTLAPPKNIADLFEPSEENQVDRFIAYLLYPQLFQRPSSDTDTPTDPEVRSTTPPPYYPSQMVADDGTCTPFQKVENTRAPGGQLFLNVDVDECKRMCLRDSECAAVDHNAKVDLCITHDALDMAMYTRKEGDGCCDHFHKTNCLPKTCYSHGVRDISGPESIIIEVLDPAITPPEGVQLQECDGGCVVEEVILISGNGTTLTSRQMSRGCLPGGLLPFGKLCVSDQRIFDNGDQLYTISCDCGFDRCNALGQSALQGLVLHLPFDGNTQDYSGSIRHAVNNGIQFDTALSMRNISAYFDGRAYCIVTSFVGYLPGVVSGPDSQRTPSLTITMWFRRQGDSDDVMTILSNGVIELWSEHKGEMQNIMASVMLEDGVGYQVQGLHELDPWVFVAVRVTYGASPDVAELQLFLNDFELATNIPHNTLQLPTLPLMQSVFPLYIGKHPLQGNYFQGFVDELFIFSDALGSKQIVTVRDLVKPHAEEEEENPEEEYIDVTSENEGENMVSTDDESNFEASIDG